MRVHIEVKVLTQQYLYLACGDAVSSLPAEKRGKLSVYKRSGFTKVELLLRVTSPIWFAVSRARKKFTDILVS